MATLANSRYEANDGSIHKIRLSDESLAVAGTPPVGSIDSDIIVKITKANTEFGIRPRLVRLSRIVGTPPDDVRVYKTIPVLTPADFASAGFQLGATITIGGVDWEIIARIKEDF